MRCNLVLKASTRHQRFVLLQAPFISLHACGSSSTQVARRSLRSVAFAHTISMHSSKLITASQLVEKPGGGIRLIVDSSFPWLEVESSFLMNELGLIQPIASNLSVLQEQRAPLDGHLLRSKLVGRKSLMIVLLFAEFGQL